MEMGKDQEVEDIVFHVGLKSGLDRRGVARRPGIDENLIVPPLDEEAVAVGAFHLEGNDRKRLERFRLR